MRKGIGSSPISSTKKELHPFGWSSFFRVRWTRTDLNADVRWTSAATSSKTGGCLNLFESYIVLLRFKFQFVGIFLLCDCHWQSTYFDSLRGAPPRRQFVPDWPAGVDTPLSPPDSLPRYKFQFILLLHRTEKLSFRGGAKPRRGNLQHRSTK